MTKSFDDVASWLARAGADLSPAELQGFLCGHLCTGARNSQSWLSYAKGFLDIGELDEEARMLLLALFEESQQHIQDADFELRLLLPDEAEDLSFRVLLVGQWCQGFLTSFGMGCTDEKASRLSDDAKSTLSDFVAIAQISDEDVDNDTAETDYTDITEYIRMAVLGLAMECRDGSPSTAQPTAMH